MKVLKFLVVISCSSMLLLYYGCKKEKDGVVVVLKQQKGKPLAQVGNITLTIEELREDFLSRQGSFKGAPNLNTEKARNDYVENQVIQEAMFLEAIENGYLDRPSVRQGIKKTLQQKFAQDELTKAQEEFTPTEEQIEDHYKRNPSYYNSEEALRVGFISIPFGDNRAKTKELATMIHKDALETIKNGNSREFSRLAMKHATKVMEAGNVSVETNETSYLDKNAFEAKFGKNSFDSIKAMETIGQIVPLMTSDTAFVIAMKTGARKALNESLEEARPKIVKRLAYENRTTHYKNLTERLRKKYNIKIYPEHFAELSKDATDNSLVKKDLPKEDLKKEELLSVPKEVEKKEQ